MEFSYYEDRASWLPDSEATALTLDASRGVTVEKIEPLAYRLSYRNKSVVFALNDLSQVKPPAAALAPDDRFIGPVFDESGVRFFLVFNTRLKLFHYILDETVTPADAFVPAPVGNGRILIGKRTGFAVYRDQHRDRKILDRRISTTMWWRTTIWTARSIRCRTISSRAILFETPFSRSRPI